MYERFTEACRAVVNAANREAMLARSQYISSGHVLVALTDAESEPVADLLRSFGAKPRKTRAAVKR